MPQASQTNEHAKITSYVYAPPSHRLLFRGSPSVPDSWLLLEGLSFMLPINNVRSPSDKLLENPLALALESMRGRALALSGTSRVNSVHLDKVAEVDVWADPLNEGRSEVSDTLAEMFIDIHSSASISRLYFENQLQLNHLSWPHGCWYPRNARRPWCALVVSLSTLLLQTFSPRGKPRRVRRPHICTTLENGTI
jgi:hypothetical protein